MTGTVDPDEALAIRRRKLKFRSWHRGMREMDLIMGRFADAFVDRMAAPELDQFERLIELPDPELMAWITGSAAPPAAHDTPMLRRLRDVHFAPRAGA
ncbi:MAG TPA: succinate dehydrogenase assembly factor 2 [Xanthobacteraceae bacterium]|nr:succinate dehydrogenase assembly factor 2 [Xanthobacteraceae bacterium]